MTNQLRLFVLIVLLPLAACTNSYRMEKAGGTVTSTTPLLAHGEKVLVMLPADGEYGAIKYAGSGTSTQRAIVAALSAAGADALTGKAIGDRSAAIAAAKQANAKWLVIPLIQGWEDRATEWSGLPDRLKIEIESNDGAYLYVVSRGSSGNWSVIFPTKEVDNGNNFIAPFRPYTVPNSGRFYFDDQAGEEKLFIVLSRKPESSFEDIIYAINTPTPQAKPQKEMQLAQNLRPIDDRLVGNVRNSMQARDLVFEKVDDSQPLAERKETAAYLINKNPAPDAKLIVDLSLKHK